MPRHYTLYEKAPERPFKCAVTGLRGPVVDLDKVIEGHGRLYLHVSVIAAIAAQHGFLSPTESKSLNQLTVESLDAAAKYPALIEEFLNDVNGAADRLRSAGSGRLVDAVEHVLDDHAEPADGEPGDADAAGAGDEPAEGGEPGGVPADADIEDHPFDQPAEADPAVS